MSDKKIFLIVDDDKDDRDFFCEAVREIDDQVECVGIANGEEAIKKLRRENVLPDIIFLDLNMPRMDGRQFLIELKKDARWANIPVIIFTTSTLQNDKDETELLGASYYLTKPKDFHVLCKQIIFVMESGWSQ